MEYMVKPKVNLLSVKKLTLNFPFLIRRNIYYLLCVKYRLNKEGISGCKTIFDIAPKYLSQKSTEELRKGLL